MYPKVRGGWVSRLLLALVLWAGLTSLCEAACPTPNPNLQGPPNIVDDCPVPASVFNKFLTGVVGSTGHFAEWVNGQVQDAGYAVSDFLTWIDVNGTDIRRCGAVCGQDATGAVSSAIASFNNAGGTVRLPSCTFIISGSISVPGGVRVTGASGGNYYPGEFTQPPTMPTQGTNIQCTSRQTSCIIAAGAGAEVDHINFVYAQPDPNVGTSWTPTDYPATFLANGTWNGLYVHDVSITAATRCFDVEGAPNYNNGQTATGLRLARVYFNGCWIKGINLVNIDQTARFDDLRWDYIWNRNAANLVAYTRANMVGVDAEYVANAQWNNIEFAFMWHPIELRNSTVTSGFGAVTFAANAWQMTNVSFNETCKGIAIPNGNGTVTSGSMTNVIAFSDTTTQCAKRDPIFFDFSSDQANWSLSHVYAGYLQTVAAVGHGAGGILKINDIDVVNYDAYGNGSGGQLPAFRISANASFTLEGSPPRGIRSTNAAPLFGAGVDGSQGYMEPFTIGAAGVEGTAALEGSRGGAYAGEIAFYLPNGKRSGVIGRGTGGSINIQPDDDGAVKLQGVTVLGALPTSCRGQPHAAIWSNGSNLQVCP